MNAGDDLFARAGRLSAHDAARCLGLTLKADGPGRWRGPCPLCGGEATSKRFSIRGRVWRCFGCQEGGDAVALVAKALRLPPREAALRLLGEDGAQRPALRRPKPPGEPSPAPAAPQHIRVLHGDTKSPAPPPTLSIGRRMWGEARSAVGTPVEAWFASRGLRLEDPHVARALRRLRFHPAAPTGRARPQTAPAMLALIVRPLPATADDPDPVEPIGVHATYLAPGGAGKARLVDPADGSPLPARKMWGACAGGAVRLSPCWRGDPMSPRPLAQGPLAVGEGIETVLAWAQGQTRPLRLAATLSLGNLQGGALGAHPVHGGVDLGCPSPDPARRPFLLPDGAGAVIVLVDADMSPIRLAVRVATPRGPRTEHRILTALERAALCARLASAHWRAAGARAVTSERPALGRDFNDALLETAA